MQPEPDATRLIAETEALIAQAKRSLEGSEGFFRDHGRDAGQMLGQLKQQREDELHRFIVEQVSLAQQQPALPAPEVEADPATRFARKVRRRRVIV